MRAAYYEAKGPAREVLRVGELERPEPAPGEVRVRVHASGVNPTDTKGRGGFRGNTAMPFPRIIPHQDGAGVIEAVGNGVPPSRIGERVWIYEAQWQRPFGTAAEYVTVPDVQAVRLPDGVSFDEGACLGIPAMTAHRCVFADGDVRGKTVLVSGGAGAVGFYAIQFARWGGATVLTTVSDDEQKKLVLGAGADHAIDRKSEDVAARVRELTGGGVDRIVEVAFGANLATDGAILNPRAVVATYASDAVLEPQFPFYAFMGRNATIHFVLVYLMTVEAHSAAARDITKALEESALQHSIARRFPLDDIAAAHEAVETGHQNGKVIVE
ncbi:MAG TPA: NADPH:quinone reductase, partial [Thermoanaerobaculia bacterium]|nr:NADPH:quinone reductase [Thermoanaerobaculia bacterium]